MVLSNKVLWVLTGIIGSVFLIIVASLAIAGKIKTTSLIIFVVIILLLVFAIDMFFWFIRKGKKVSVEREGRKIKVIDLEQAREITKDMLMSEQYSEYIREERYEDIWHLGVKETPVYVRLVKGEFDGNLLGLIVNMENPERRGIKEYKETEINQQNILLDMERRGNLIAMSPRAIPSHEEEVIERPGGEVVRRRRTISHEDKEFKIDGGLK